MLKAEDRLVTIIESDEKRRDDFAKREFKNLNTDKDVLVDILDTLSELNVTMAMILDKMENRDG